LTPGNVVDYAYIIRTISSEIFPRVALRDIGFDPYGATMLAASLQGGGVPMVEVTQSMRMLSEPAQYLQTLVRARRLRHDGSPVLRWCVSNCGVKESAYGDIIPRKLRARQRIDGVTAIVIALNRWLRTPDALPAESAYADGHGLVVV